MQVGAGRGTVKVIGAVGLKMGAMGMMVVIGRERRWGGSPFGGEHRERRR